MSNLVHNEIQKLRASFFNGCGIASGDAGVVIPFLQFMQQSTMSGEYFTKALISVVFGMSLGGLFHSIARIYIYKMKER